VRRPLDRSVVFIAFSGEELGALGSDYYVKHATVPVDSITAMLNMDMVGRLRNAKLIVLGAATAQEFPALLDSLNRTPASRASTCGRRATAGAERPGVVLCGAPGVALSPTCRPSRSTDDADKINIVDSSRPTTSPCRHRAAGRP
jgi:hypothetical protein